MSSHRRMHSSSPSCQVQVQGEKKPQTVLEGNINTPGLGRRQAPTGPHPKHPGCHSNLFVWILIMCQILCWEYFNHSGSTNSLLGGKKKSWQQIIHGSNYLSVLVCFESECRSSITALCSQCHTEPGDVWEQLCLGVQARPIIRLLYLGYGGVMYLPRRTS